MEERITFTIRAPAPSAANKDVVRRQRKAVEEAVETWQDVLGYLAPDDLEALTAHMQRWLRETDPMPPGPLRAAGEGWSTRTAREQAAHKYTVLLRSFLRRRGLLADSLSSTQVAALLGTSRQTPHDRVHTNTLLAVHDGGALRFPIWQFDPDGPNGVVDGLPEVLQALKVSPLAKVSWLMRPNPALEGRTPLDGVKSGEVKRIVQLARAVGVV